MEHLQQQHIYCTGVTSSCTNQIIVGVFIEEKQELTAETLNTYNKQAYDQSTIATT